MRCLFFITISLLVHGLSAYSYGSAKSANPQELRRRLIPRSVNGQDFSIFPRARSSRSEPGSPKGRNSPSGSPRSRSAPPSPRILSPQPEGRLQTSPSSSPTALQTPDGNARGHGRLPGNGVARGQPLLTLTQMRVADFMIFPNPAPLLIPPGALERAPSGGSSSSTGVSGGSSMMNGFSYPSSPRSHDSNID